eukprot:scaffold143769_cov17-Tisochrysis_lutea.AAC.1
MQLASTLRQLGAQGRSPSLILSLAHAKAASGSLPLWLSWSLRQVCLAGFMQLAVARASRTSPNEHEAAFLQKYSPSLWMPLMQLMDGISLQTAPAAQHRQLSSESNKQVQGTPSRSGPATPTPSSSSLSTPRLQPSPLMRSAREMQLQEAQHKQHRAWVWYDAVHEALEQRGERKRSYPDAGYANLQNVPQSMKKMNRVLEL